MLKPAPGFGRLSLRGDAAAMAAAGSAFGLALPQAACRAASIPSRAALWLGPDEFLLLVPEAELPAVRASLAGALDGTPHSLVDISHRQFSLIVEGPTSENLLNTGCPLDLGLESFPVDMCTRTLLGKTEIVLWRTDVQRFHLEVARSTVPYVTDFLRHAALGSS